MSAATAARAGFAACVDVVAAFLRTARQIGTRPLHRAGNRERCWASLSGAERRAFVEGTDRTIRCAVSPADCPDCCRPYVQLRPGGERCRCQGGE